MKSVSSPQRATLNKVKALLALFVLANFSLWYASSHVQAQWDGVPPVPTQQGATMMMLGDEQFSFRFGALTLQHLGDGGGRVTPIKDYDFEKLGRWFWLLHALDPASEHVPFIAAYYFGGTPNPEQVGIVVDYLGKIGENPYGEKWRWLAHAAYLARHKMKDLQLALDLAYRLSRMQLADGEVPLWARQLPAFILKEQGGIESAKEFIETMLLDTDTTNPNEVNFMKSWLIEQVGVPKEEVEAILEKRAAAGKVGPTKE